MSHDAKLNVKKWIKFLLWSEQQQICQIDSYARCARKGSIVKCMNLSSIIFIMSVELKLMENLRCDLCTTQVYFLLLEVLKSRYEQ